ncbi:transposase [Kaistella sp. BT6-1-3]|uniref:Transposase n=1 Tax=Kaistella yananensis TaxID=2989820 RepID=A0ABT3JKA7_9FLAO|nr:transposase [Kaistella yananensis]MCW4451208.1 transposase [Kaistella yananensis]
MNKTLLLFALSFVTFGYTQTNFEEVKKENENLQSLNKVLTSENEYLKKVLDINKPMLETEKENSAFKITKAVGNTKDKTIVLTFLVETKNENKKMVFEDISMVDIEGNGYKIDYFKSSKTFADLALNTPIKLNFSFKDIQGNPLFIKMFRFKTTSQPERNLFEKKKSNVEFKDINVVWD